MRIEAANSLLENIPTSKIDRNPDNPRILFRPKELDWLLSSISQHGVQVPISVYKNKGRYVLIDGERRWRCALKLNNKTIPALIQDRPDDLTNLLLMFNIHSLREQWDLLTISMKLPKVIELLRRKKGTGPTERDISAQTGLLRSTIRRCKLLIELPDEYKNQILDELKKPKPQQKLTEDFFIEMERALKTVERAMPDVVGNKNRVRRVLIRKFRDKTIINRVDFRDLAKIARAERVDADPERAAKALRRVFEPNNYSIEDAYSASVSTAYSERDLLTRVNGLLERLGSISREKLDPEVIKALRKLERLLTRLLSQAE
jgi:ParB/RepB/Spo0J family partition protein